MARPPSCSVVPEHSGTPGVGPSQQVTARLTEGTGLARGPHAIAPGLTSVTHRVISTARLAPGVSHVADCRGCSVECRCCAPPAGRTESESHSTRRLICQGPARAAAALGRTYGNLSGSAVRWLDQAPGGFLPPDPRPRAADPLAGKSVWISLSAGLRHARPRGSEEVENRAPGFQSAYERQDY